MNGTLFIALLIYCKEYSAFPSSCIREKLDCVVTAGAYDMQERKAARVVADCVAPKEKK
jgi:hypothetical protein